MVKKHDGTIEVYNGHSLRDEISNWLNKPQSNRHLLVYGPSQSGKKTIIRDILKARKYIIKEPTREELDDCEDSGILGRHAYIMHMEEIDIAGKCGLSIDKFVLKHVRKAPVIYVCINPFDYGSKKELLKKYQLLEYKVKTAFTPSLPKAQPVLSSFEEKIKRVLEEEEKKEREARISKLRDGFMQITRSKEKSSKTSLQEGRVFRGVLDDANVLDDKNRDVNLQIWDVIILFGLPPPKGDSSGDGKNTADLAQKLLVLDDTTDRVKNTIYWNYWTNGRQQDTAKITQSDVDAIYRAAATISDTDQTRQIDLQMKLIEYHEIMSVIIPVMATKMNATMHYFYSSPFSYPKNKYEDPNMFYVRAILGEQKPSGSAKKTEEDQLYDKKEAAKPKTPRKRAAKTPKTPRKRTKKT